MKITKDLINDIPVISYEIESDEKKPLIFFFHGFTGNKDTLMDRGEKLAKLGFYVVAIDAYLHGERMPEWFKALPNEEKYQYIIDIAIQTSYDAKYLWENIYRSNEKIKSDKFYTYGVSMGAMTSYSLSTLTNDIAGMLTLVGNPSFVDYYLEKQEKFNWDNSIVEDRIRKYKDLEPLNNINKINKDLKIFIALGQKDDVVDPRFSREFFRKRSTNSTLKEYDTGHISTNEMLEDGYDFLRELIK